MFEQSLVESTGRIRTRSRRYVVPSFLLEAALVTTLILLPWLYPASLPRTSLVTPLMVPLPPPAVAVTPQPTSAAPVPRLQILNIYAPSRIPTTIAPIVDNPPGSIVPGTASLGPGIPGMSAASLFPATPRLIAHVARSSGPLRVSAGVAAGQLIIPIQPRYPAIAQQARIQGTVVVSAIIGTDGRIASLRVLSGPPLKPSSTPATVRGPSTASPSKSKPPSKSSSPSISSPSTRVEPPGGLPPSPDTPPHLPPKVPRPASDSCPLSAVRCPLSAVRCPLSAVRRLRCDTMKPVQVLVYSASWCRDCREAKRFLETHNIPFTEIDIEETPNAAAEVFAHVGKYAIPQFVIDGEWVQPYRPGRGFLYAEMSLRFGVNGSSPRR